MSDRIEIDIRDIDDKGISETVESAITGFKNIYADIDISEGMYKVWARYKEIYVFICFDLQTREFIRIYFKKYNEDSLARVADLLNAYDILKINDLTGEKIKEYFYQSSEFNMQLERLFYLYITTQKTQQDEVVTMEQVKDATYLINCILNVLPTIKD